MGVYDMGKTAWSKNKEGVKLKGIFYYERNKICKTLSIKAHFTVATFLNRYFRFYKNLKYIPKQEMSFIDSVILTLYKEYSKDNFEVVLKYIKFNKIEELDNETFQKEYFILIDNEDLEDFVYNFKLKHLAKIKLEKDLKQQYKYIEKHINKYILKYTIDDKKFFINFETKSNSIANKTVTKFEAFNVLFGIEIDAVLYASSKENIEKTKDCEKTQFPIQFIKYLDKE